MKGSSSAKSTPANALRTGKPSPSKPCGAVVTLLTPRALADGSAITLGNIVMSATVTAGKLFLLYKSINSMLIY